MARGHEVTVLTTSPEPSFESEEGGLRVIRLRSLAEPLRNPISVRLPLEFRRRVKNADVVHLHSPYTFTTLLSYPFSPKGRTIITLHGRPYYTGLARLLARIHERISFLLLRGAGKFIALTELDASYMESMGISPSKIEIIPNFVDVRELEGWSEEAEPVEKDHEIQLLYVGGFVEAKGLDQLLLDLKSLSGLDVGLWMIGSGPLEGRLRSLAGGLDVRFLGRRSRRELVPYFKGADALILPSRSEGFPTVVLEAAALGTPVILSDIPVHRLLFRDMALFYTPRDPRTLRRALDKLVTGVENLIERAGKEVRSKYDLRVVGERILNLYRSLADIDHE